HSTAAKWRRAATTEARSRYVVANGYGADPGASTDRALLEADPYADIEGVAIAAFAIGAEEAFISVRATATETVRRLQAAVDAATSRNLIGDDALGRARRGDLAELHRRRRAGQRAAHRDRGAARPGRVHARRGDRPAQGPRRQTRP